MDRCVGMGAGVWNPYVDRKQILVFFLPVNTKQRVGRCCSQVGPTHNKTSLYDCRIYKTHFIIIIIIIIIIIGGGIAQSV